ncbi:MAG: FHA domain-containing protein [Kiritimatiellia bacterium]
MYRLLFLSGRYQGKRLVVRQAVALVGRDAACHLFLPDDDLLAPRHARFEERGTGVFLSRLSPATPVERNGAPIADAVRLVHGDELLIGQTRIQFQEIIAPHKRLRPSIGLLQPAAFLFAAAIVAAEIALLAFLADWPRRVILPETERADIARAERIRAAAKGDSASPTGAVAKAAAPASVVVLPGTAAATNAAPDAASTNRPAAAMLEDADFAPADTNASLAVLPQVSAADVRIEQAQRLLAEASAAAQMKKYDKAVRILDQIHQTAPGFLPAHAEHARLLEARGDLDAAQQRWTQILGLAPDPSPFRTQALEQRERLANLQTLQTRILQTPQPSDPDRLPRDIRIVAPSVTKMPSDADVDEMRVLTATLELFSDEKLFRNAVVQVFATFYDAAEGGTPRPTRAIAGPSPIVLGTAFANQRSAAVEATYVVTRGLRAQEERDTGQAPAYYGFTLHVFAGQILQDAFARPKKLLELPIHFPAPGN